MKNKNVWKAFDGIVQQLESCLRQPKTSSKKETPSKKTDSQQTTKKSTSKKLGKNGKAVKR
jgi:hypothetical protein